MAAAEPPSDEGDPQKRPCCCWAQRGGLRAHDVESGVFIETDRGRGGGREGETMAKEGGIRNDFERVDHAVLLGWAENKNGKGRQWILKNSHGLRDP